MAIKTVRRSISMTPEMRDLLGQIAAKHGREVKEVDLIRDAIRQYLDNQGDVAGSRRHFARSMQGRLDALEEKLTLQMNVLIFLLAQVLGDETGQALEAAARAAHHDGGALLKRVTTSSDSKPRR